MTDPQSLATTYGYDTIYRLNALAFNGQNPGFTFGYDSLSRRNSLTRPNGVNTTYAYDPASSLTSVLHKLGTTTLDGATYTYDNAENRKTRTDKRLNTTLTYFYDNIYQLQTAKQGSTTKESYTYDLVGNRKTSLNVSQYNYNTSNELTSTPTITYGYDSNGNLKTKSDGTAYNWDYENRLTSVVLPGTGGTVSFKYDAFGRRAQKSFVQGTTTTTTNYLYDGPNLFEEIDSAGNLVARYEGASGIDEQLAELRSGTTSYYAQDGLGSVTSLSNSAGALVNTYSYDSYGNSTGTTGTIVNPFRYTGRELDAETGIYEYRARYYDPTIGRFLNEDGLRFGAGPNFYPYANNSPNQFNDPNGTSAAGAATALENSPAPAFCAANPLVCAAIGVDVGLAVYDGYELYRLCQAYGYCNPSSAPSSTPGPYPSPLDWHSGEAIRKCSNNGCKPCVPPVGTIAYRVDTYGSHTHRGLPVPHWKLSVMKQSPAPTCKCFWDPIEDNQGGFGGGTPPANTVPIGPAGGGGVK